MSGGSVSDNTAAGWGAGLCLSNGTLEIIDVVVEGNGRRGFASVGGGIYACGGSDVSIEGGSVLNNELFGKEGTGIGVDEFSTLEILDVTVSGNRGRMSDAGIAVTDSEATIDGAVIENNFTYGSGAGLLVGEGATVHMLSGSINNNRCRVDGGGVEVAFGGSFHMSDGEISGNLAWVGSNLESSSADDEMGPLADGGLTSEHFNMGGGIDARGDLCVSGGTNASNGAIIGCGICFNCERWDTERHDLALSGAPLFKDNYLSWAKYSETDVSIYMGDNEDESALVRVDGSLQPLRPIRIEKLYRSGWETIALVDEGDYEVGAFRSMQSVTWDTTSPYMLTKRDGLLYAALPQNTAEDLPSADSSGFGQQDSGIHPPCGPFQSPSASPHPGVRQRGVSRCQIAWAPVPLRVGLRRGPAVRYLVPSMGRAFFGGSWRRAFAPWYGVGSADPMGWARSAWMYPAYCQPWMRYGYGRSANVFASAMLRCPGYAGFDWRNPYVGAWGSWW